MTDLEQRVYEAMERGKDVDERTTLVCTEIMHAIPRLAIIDVLPLCEAVRMALLAQDKLTRHACAEAVASAACTVDDPSDDFVFIGAAQAACINVRE